MTDAITEEIRGNFSALFFLGYQSAALSIPFYQKSTLSFKQCAFLFLVRSYYYYYAAAYPLVRICIRCASSLIKIKSRMVKDSREEPP